MPTSIRRTTFRVVAAVALAVAPFTCVSAASAPAQVAAPVEFEIDEGGIELANGRVAVFVEMAGAPAAEVYARERARALAANQAPAAAEVEAAERGAARAAFATAAQLAQVQRSAIETMTREHGAYVMYNARFAANGIAVMVRPESLVALRAIPGVVRVSLIARQQPHAVSSIDFTGARTFWGTAPPNLNLRGSGIGVGVIDTGIDHMHTNFGGPGGSNYALGVTTATPFPAPPAIPTATAFPTPKVVWGFDFVGDAYNANGTTDAALLPVPDPNPMDSNGHGSGVSSLMAGFGTNNNGTTYTGSYTESTPNIFTDNNISPGYAPASPLYAFRVFGTAGSTLVTTAALDSATAIYLWQSDTSVAWDGSVSATVFNAAGQPVVVNYSIPQPPATPRLRVINLSLGSNAGDIEESSAVAAQRAADAGLIVVMSAGNADDSYYITGAPGVATGGISVAASFNNQFPGGAANAPANPVPAPPQPALVGAPINNIGTASYTTGSPNFAFTDAVYGLPSFGGRTAPAPVGYTPPGGDLGNLVTLVDAAGLDINLFAVDGGGNLIVTLNPAAANIYAGKVVLMDRGGGIGFHQKALAVQRAGGIAALIVNNAPGVGGMAANVNLPVLSIPSLMIEQSIGASFTLDGSLNTATPRPTVQTRPGLQISFTPFSQALQDTMAAYSSRGPRRNDDAIKPDITAPAENVTVARATSGNAVTSFNGTSSAAPHTAGAMALLRQLHPTWTNYELKSLLINNARNDIYTQLGANPGTPPSGQTWGATRQGVGRWDLSRYAGGGQDVIMFVDDPLPTDGGVSRKGAVSVSFGVFDVEGTVTRERNVFVRNKGAGSRTFDIGLIAVTDTPGVSYSFPDGNTITVPGLSERTFRVRISADADAMRHARDLSLRPFQFIISTAPANRVPRQFLNEESAYITLTPAGTRDAAGSPPTHRLTVQAFPRRASAVGVDAATVEMDSTQTVGFNGSGYNTGTNTAFVDTATFTVQPSPVDVVSFAKGFELAYAADPTPGLQTAQRGADLQYVGVTSDFPTRATPFDPTPTGNQSTVLVFGIATHGEFDTVQSGFGAEYQIEIDSTLDQVADRMVRQFAFTNGERTTVTSNIMLPVVSVTPPFTSGVSTGWFLNVFSNVYTNLYNNSVVMIPVSVSGGNGSLGLTAATSRFNYRVTARHRGTQISQTPWLSYDVARPGISFDGVTEPSMFAPFDAGGAPQSFSITSNLGNFNANGSGGLLMLYPMNAAGSRAQTVGFSIGDDLFSDGFEEPPER